MKKKPNKKNHNMPFDERLKKAEEALNKKQMGSFKKEGMDFKDIALRASTDMVSALIIGCGLGWTFDHFEGTFPWGIIVGFLFGTVAGLLTIYKTLLKKIR
jgi:ATP synthase protein I